MKLSESYFYTIRENLSDEETVSGNLLVRSGMVKKVSNGIYMYMPLGLKTLRNIETVIRKHMNKSSQELLMPNLLPEEAYINSKRRENFGNDMFSLSDRYNRKLVLGPTHEEFFVDAAKMKIKSYKDLPFNLYQIGNKYRDEPRPRYGLIRVREFFMKDAYSFDKDIEGLDKSYEIMYNSYHDIFKDLGIDYRVVTADTGVMGGLLSEEFQAVTDIGEDILVMCECGYSSNNEVSKCEPIINPEEERLNYELVETPDCKTIDKVCSYLKVDKSKSVKNMLYKAGEEFYLCLLSGDRELNELKLRKLLNVTSVEMASAEDIEKLNLVMGYIGPINSNLKIVIDNDLLYKYNYVVGANKKDYHYKNVNTSDFNYDYVGDIKTVKENDVCPECGKPLVFKNGIEIGNTFKLGNKYSNLLDLKYSNDKNELVPVEMGCYGIGLGRILAAYIEQNNDENGIIFNNVLAPYLINIVLINSKDELQSEYANKLYETLSENYEVMLDNRDERAGIKFNDSDLLGIPYRITIGNKIKENIVELKLRNTGEVIEVSVDNLEETLKNYIK